MISMGIFSHFLFNSFLQKFFLKINVLITAIVAIFTYLQIQRSGIRIVPQNPWVDHRLLRHLFHTPDLDGPSYRPSFFSASFEAWFSNDNSVITKLHQK